MCNFDRKYEAQAALEDAAEEIFNIQGMKQRHKAVILNGIFTALDRVQRIKGVGENGDFKVRLERKCNV